MNTWSNDKTRTVGIQFRCPCVSFYNFLATFYGRSSFDNSWATKDGGHFCTSAGYSTVAWVSMPWPACLCRDIGRLLSTGTTTQSWYENVNLDVLPFDLLCQRLCSVSPCTIAHGFECLRWCITRKARTVKSYPRGELLIACKSGNQS